MGYLLYHCIMCMKIPGLLKFNCKKQNFVTFSRKIRESFYDFGIGKNFFK